MKEITYLWLRLIPCIGLMVLVVFIRVSDVHNRTRYADVVVTAKFISSAPDQTQAEKDAGPYRVIYDFNKKYTNMLYVPETRNEYDDIVTGQTHLKISYKFDDWE